MKLVITEHDYKYGYLCVADKDSCIEYFVQGEQYHKDNEYIKKYGEEAFLDKLASSEYFDN